ncbi:MAG: hypothetical protein LBU34_03265 [Planctomycetaceae bacterium]|jgi:NADH:ubiquinone oxidoreductase subunit 6 (subunit J)|nr:hypothetical protein [Planctomycetaceae bacterium]
MPQHYAISFFFVLFLTATILLSLLLRYGFSKSITLFNGLRFGLVWIVFVIAMLVINQAARETFQPKRWSREQLFVPIIQNNIENNLPNTNTVGNLLFGWLFFPLQTIPQARMQAGTIFTGAVVFLITGIVLEISGRTLVSSWRSRWTTVVLLGFLLLNLMTYSAIGFIRQAAWILIP